MAELDAAHGSTTRDGGALGLVGADRVLAVLLELGAHPGGASLDTIAAAVGSPKPTVHRALAALRRAGLAVQRDRGVYLIGDDFLRIAFQHAAERPDGARIAPALEALASAFGETAHYAVLDGVDVVYRAKTDPNREAVRLSSVVGGRNPAARTAVGKLLLSAHVRDEASLRRMLGDGPLPAATPNTITDVGALWAELQLTRERGFAVDDQENEIGVNCVAVPVDVDPHRTGGAVSVSALAFRTPLPSLVDAIPRIHELLDDALGDRGPSRSHAHR